MFQNARCEVLAVKSHVFWDVILPLDKRFPTFRRATILKNVRKYLPETQRNTPEHLCHHVLVCFRPRMFCERANIYDCRGKWIEVVRSKDDYNTSISLIGR